MTAPRKIIILAVVVGLLAGFGAGYLRWGKRTGGDITSAGVSGDAQYSDKKSDEKKEPIKTALDAQDIQKEVEQNQAAVIASIKGNSVPGVGDAVEVSNQSAGMAIVASRVLLTAAGWVAVHEDMSGDLGNVLGARGFAAGEYRDVHVPLLRGTTAGRIYHVGIYRENGDGKYDRKTDTLLRLEDGEMIGQSFVAQ